MNAHGQNVPEWLVDLENKREKKKGSRLGHEIGANAKCNVCGDGCPGLDLHFWRKTCKNCKCRKEDHDIHDDELSWAQFEILGQMRSKPGYVKVSKIAQEPVKLDWIPPNVDNELVTDYMEQLESSNVPVSGSEAALKRKQQLQIQVPKHDLDSVYCDNLTESEVQQLEKYADKIKEKCVGQGDVVRIESDSLLPVSPLSVTDEDALIKFIFKQTPIPDQIVIDRILFSVVDQVQSVMGNSTNIKNNLQVCVPLERKLNFAPSTREKIKEVDVNDEVVLSTVVFGAAYDRIVSELITKQIIFSSESTVGQVQKMRAEYWNDRELRNDFDKCLKEILGGAQTEPLAVTLNSANNNFGALNTNLENYVPPSDDNTPNRNLIEPMENVRISGENAIETPMNLSSIGQMSATSCQRCHINIKVGTVVVKAARAGKDAAWHPQCFTCKTCNELLADLVYFYHESDIYCARDLAAILKIPRCKACDELIFTKKYTAAEGFQFHIKHFCCYQCDLPLAGREYIPCDETNNPCCLVCYDHHYGKKCQKCQLAIKPTEKGVSWDKTNWHEQCFRCVGQDCNKSLIGQRFCIKSSFPFCSSKCIGTKK
ncbi:hypothetical protein HA402_005772 [Bradysia odoriphaga]|nr:hypothetical protein HA402_005772 [Bradysia odoriphaga]